MKRVLLFLLLLALGVALLLILARENPGTADPESPALEGSLSASDPTQGSRTVIDGFSGALLQDPPDGKGPRVPRYQYEWKRAIDEGDGLVRLEKGFVRVLQEKKPEETSMILRAGRGTAYLSGAFEEARFAEDKLMHFEDGVEADLIDPEGQIPPIRIKTASIDGLLAEKRFWTESAASLEHPGSEDFFAEGEGLQGDAGKGSVTLQKNAKVKYLLRPSEGAAPDRELRLSCRGPLRLENADLAGGGQGRTATAEGGALLEIETLSDRSIQRVRAEKLIAWIRRDAKTQKSPIAFERIEALGSVRIEADQMSLFGDRARGVIRKSGGLESARIEGSPRAAFASSSAGSLAGESAKEESSILFILCDGPITLAALEGKEEAFEMLFEKHVLLLGRGERPYRPNRFENHLHFVLERQLAMPGEKPAGFRILSAHAEGGVAWRDELASIHSTVMELEPGDAKTAARTSFFPSPLLATRTRSSFLGGGPPGKGPGPEKKLILWASDSLIQEEGALTLEGKVLGSVHAPGSSPGKIVASGLKLLPSKSGSGQIVAENGLDYDEGEGGLRILAAEVLPHGESGTLLRGNPAELRQPGSDGKTLEIAASWISLDPASGRIEAGDKVNLLLPPDAAPLLASDPGKAPGNPEPLRLSCDSLEGEQGNGETPLRWLKAQGDVRLLGKNQEAGGLALHLDFGSKLHRLFGSEESPAWIAGPIDRGHFSARSLRIDIRNEGERIDLAPNARVEIRGEAADFGKLSPQGGDGGIRVLPRGESRIERELIVFDGGVRMQSLDSSPQTGWVLHCRKLSLHRDPKTGETERMDAEGQAEFVAPDLLANAEHLQFWPKSSNFLLQGDGETQPTLEFPYEMIWRNEWIEYNLETHLIRSGPGSIVF